MKYQIKFTTAYKKSYKHIIFEKEWLNPNIPMVGRRL